MEHLFDNSPFRSYAFCVAILVARLIYLSIYTALRGHGSAQNREDMDQLGSTEVRSQEHPAVARALRIPRNDSERIPAFFASGLGYVLTGASRFGAWLWCGVFTLSRIRRTAAYMNSAQPLSGVSFQAGVVSLGIVSLIALFRVI